MIQPASTVSAGAQRPCVFATLSLSPPETSSTQVHPGAAQTSQFSRGGSHLPGSLPRILWLARQVPRLGLQLPWSRSWSLGPYCPKAISLSSDFSMSSTILASNLHICWDTVGCSLCSSEDELGVPLVCRGKWTLL